MVPPIDLASLSAPAQKIASPGAPPKMREMAAKGVAPGVRPPDLVCLLAYFARGDEPALREIASSTLAKLPEPVLQGALEADLQPAAIDALAPHLTARHEHMAKLLRMPRVDNETVEGLARSGSEAISEIVATNEERLLAHPRIVELLYLNKHTRASTADRLVELMTRHGIELKGIPAWREAAAAIQDELVAEPSDEPLPEDLDFRELSEIAEALAHKTGSDEDTHAETEDGQEVLKEEFMPLQMQLAKMSIGKRIRRAIIGTREERMLLVRDSNRMVASAAVRSPAMQESEVALITKNRNLSDEVLRIVGTTAEWLKSYSIKRNLVENPRTPISIATRLVEHLRESDLKKISKSKNVTGPVQDAARRHLNRRQS